MINRTLSCLTLAALVLLLSVAPTFAVADSAVSLHIPWSGYWWPTTGGGLSTGIGYRGHPAPLEKYDLLKDGAYPGPASQWDLANNYDPNAPDWYGLCGAWAAASVYEAIDFKLSVHQNIVFYVGDKKGLMTALHELSWEAGIRENPETPDIFHRWLLTYIKEQGAAFYAELDPGEEVWNYPVYRYQMETTDNGGSLDVVCTIWYADDLVEPDYVGTRSLAERYTYRLFLSGGAVVGGEWTGASVYNRPSQLIMPTVPVARNPHLNYDFIRSIATSVDDEWESDVGMDLLPGGYNLILLNADRYRLRGAAGDVFLLRIEPLDGFAAPLWVSVTDAAGQTVYQGDVADAVDIRINAINPPYDLIVDCDDYGGGVVYRVEYDLKKSFEFVNSKLQKGFGWGGVAIVNPGAETCGDIYVVGYTKEGRPLETFFGPFSLAPGQKTVFFTSELEPRAIEQDAFQGIRVLAPAELSIVNLTGYFERNMSAYGPDAANQWMAVPDTVAAWTGGKSISWGVYNPNPEAIVADMRLFSGQGTLLDTVAVSLPADSVVHYTKTSTPFTAKAQDGGWALVRTEATGGFKGYVEWIENGLSKAEALHPTGPGTRLAVPHVARTAMWQTRVVLIDASGEANSAVLLLVCGSALHTLTVEFGPYERKEMDLGDLFGLVPDADLNRSALLIQSDGPLTGFWGYDTSADYLFYPLLDPASVAQELVLPHIAAGAAWWTGVTLFNPSDSESVVYRIVPYDMEGRLIESVVLTRTLPPWEKDVLSIGDLFGSLAESISFLKIEVQTGGGLIGVYGIGNPDCSMLSGDVLR